MGWAENEKAFARNGVDKHASVLHSCVSDSTSASAQGCMINSFSCQPLHHWPGSSALTACSGVSLQIPGCHHLLVR